MKASMLAAWPLLWAAIASGEESPPYSGLPPGEALKTLRVAPGFRVEFFAHEPDVADPVAISWDERGRAWVAEMPDYPADGPAGRIRVLEDTDLDGKADRSTVFAEGLSYPTSVLPHRHGVLVASAPEILFLEDTDGDGKADSRSVVLTGFGLSTTQLRVNGLMYGMDGRIYAANGRSGGKVRRPGDPIDRAVDIAQRDLRFDATTYEPEAIAGPSQFGHAFDIWGHRFLSWNTNHIRQAMLSPRDLERHPRLTRTATVASISDHGDSARIYPVTPPPRTFNNEPTDHFNASCGLTIEDGGIFPETHAGNAFVCEPLVGLVHRDVLAPGTGTARIAVRGEEGTEFLASSDPWFHPVFARSGPDGALFIVDFYREMVEHPEYVRKELRGQVNFTVGRGRGRIYRILPVDTRALRAPAKLSSATAPELVAHLASPNARVRELAQRCILERRSDDLTDPLRRLARRAGIDGPPMARVWALWTLLRLARLDLETLEGALNSSTGPSLECVLRLLREFQWAALEPGDLARCTRAVRGLDLEPASALQRILLNGDFNPGRGDWGSLQLRGLSDTWQVTAFLSGLAGFESASLLGAVSGPSAGLDGSGEAALGLYRDVAELLGADPGQAGKALPGILAELAGSQLTAPRTFAIAEGVAAGLKRSGTPPPSGREWDAIAAGAGRVALDGGATSAHRLRAIALLGHSTPDAAVEPLSELISPQTDLDIVRACVTALGSQDSASRAQLLLASWPRATPAVRNAILDALSRRPSTAAILASAIDAGAVRPSEIDLPRRGTLLKTLPPAARTRLEELLAASGATSTAARSAIVASYQDRMPASGNARKGSEVFAARCATCHRFAGLGFTVGPELVGSGKKRREELLTAIFDPNQAIVPGYVAVTVVLESGEVLTGIVGAETERAVTLRRADGKEDSILRKSIRSLESSGTSLMPEGLESFLSPESTADLLEFLGSGDSAPR